MFCNTKEDIDYLRENCSIQQYAEDVLGILEWQQLSGSQVKPKLETAFPDSGDFSSLVIKLSTNRFTRYSGRGRNPQGSILDFIMNTEDCDFPAAVKILLNYANNTFDYSFDREAYAKEYEKKKESMQCVSKDFILPRKYKNTKRLYAYIVKHRQIDKEIYNYFLDNGFMYQSYDCKCVYVSYDEFGTPIFGCVRDTNWNERITYGVTGSFVDNGFYINNGSKSMVVTEAVIDCMAYQSLLLHRGENYKSYNYLALTGCSKIRCIKYHLEKDDTINTLYLAYDNDEAGEDARAKTKEMLIEMGWKGHIVNVRIPKSHGKDINDELKYRNALQKAA